MQNGNEIVSRVCRFLSDDSVDKLYATFSEAFSDYVFPFALTETQFHNHLNLNAVDLTRTMGCFEGDDLIGFSMNGFGDWEGKRTVYDAGTGVVPAKRRQGVSREMFDKMIPLFRDDGYEQYLLEVVTTNTSALRLYEGLGFYTNRELALLQCDGTAKVASAADGVEIREIDEPDWALFASFGGGKPSWQNSPDALRRSRKLKRFFGAFVDGKCAGYIVFSAKFGRIAQIAVAPEHRNRGIATALVQRTQAETVSGYSMQVVNIDKSLTDAAGFFRKCGFYERLAQYEMIKPL